MNQCRKEGIVVHVYRAKTSSTIYLKFDWGVAHSLRISDHKGIEKYHYRFNLIKGLKEVVRVEYKNKNHSNYYPFREIYQCWDEIVDNRKRVLEKKGKEEYQREMQRVEARINRLPKDKLYPFWKYGKRLN